MTNNGEEIVHAAAVIAAQANRRTVSTTYIRAALSALYPNKAEDLASAGNVYMMGAKMDENDLKTEKVAVGLLRREIREIIEKDGLELRLNQDVPAFLRGVLLEMDKTTMGDEIEISAHLIEAACVVLRSSRHKILTPEDILTAAKILFPDLVFDYKPDPPHAGRSTTTQSALKKRLKKRAAEIVEGGRINKKVISCLEFILTNLLEESPATGDVDAGEGRTSGQSEQIIHAEPAAAPPGTEAPPGAETIKS